MTLANDSVLVTPGAGATIATHLAGGKEYQVVMSADITGNILDTLDTYYAYANNVAFAQNKHFLSIFNGSGSGKIIKIRKIFLINLQVVAITGVMVRFDFYGRTTAQSAGTAVTAFLADSTNAALPAQISIATGATVTTAGLVFSHATTNEEVGATGTLVAGSAIMAATNFMPEARNIQELILRETQGFTVQMVTATTVGSFGVLAVFTME